VYRTKKKLKRKSNLQKEVQSFRKQNLRIRDMLQSCGNQDSMAVAKTTTTTTKTDIDQCNGLESTGLNQHLLGQLTYDKAGRIYNGEGHMGGSVN